MKKFIHPNDRDYTQELCSALTSSPPASCTNIIKLIGQCTEVEINQVDSEGVPPVYYAIVPPQFKSTDLTEGEINQIIEKFIAQGADIHHPECPHPLLSQAVQFNYPTVVEHLLKQGARVNQSDTLSLLHQAALHNSDQVIPLLLKQENCLLNAQDSETGNTPLHYACSHINPKAIRVLLGAGADLNIQNNEGNTPLHVMANKNKRDAFEACIQSVFLEESSNHKQKINFSLENQEGKTALQVAEEKRYHTMSQLLFIYGNEETTSTAQPTFRPR